MSLSKKSNDEIRKLLGEHGIKHGPVVDTTRKQYEKKLENAVEKSSVKTFSDKTYYREEEETSYITYSSPFREEAFVDTLTRRGVAAQGDDKNLDRDTDSKPTIHFTSKTVNHSVKQSSLQYNRPPIKSGGGRWKVVWLLLLAVFAAVCYCVYLYLWK